MMQERNGVIRAACLCVLAAFLAWLPLAQAQESSRGPHEVVADVTEQVLKLVDERQDLLSDDPEAFYEAVGGVLEQVVAFDYIARGVMGSHAADASEAQRARFSEVFQRDLVNTYAKGMAMYADSKVEVVPPAQATGEQRRVSVNQIVQTDKGEHKLSYTMGKSTQDHQWKLLNVTINGINLGKTFRSQFAQSMKKHGDLGAVIDNWSAESSSDKLAKET